MSNEVQSNNSEKTGGQILAYGAGIILGIILLVLIGVGLVAVTGWSMWVTVPLAFLLQIVTNSSFFFYLKD